MKIYGSSPEIISKVAPNIYNHQICREISVVINLCLLFTLF